MYKMKFTIIYCIYKTQYHRSLRSEEYIHKTRKKKGGPFLCAHLRRKDFIKYRGEKIPNIIDASEQIRRRLIMEQQQTYGSIQMLYSFTKY